MKLPYIVKDPLTEEQIKTWNEIFLPTRGSNDDKTVEQSLWRRNQTEGNKEVSGWQGPHNKKRKILYYKHAYDVIDHNNAKHLAMVSSYVYLALTLDKADLDAYRNVIAAGIIEGGWDKIDEGFYRSDDLTLRLTHYVNPSDRPKEYDIFPESYETLEIEVKSRGFEVTNEQDLIWNIAQAGLRKSAKRTNPTYISNAEKIVQYLPCQVEVGCGPSYEAGVYPLHTLHELYSINEPFSKKFIIDAENDTFVSDLIARPQQAYFRMSEFYSKIITAKLTDFYKYLKKMYDLGYIVGPILTNNFDGLHLRLGIPEIFIRTYDEVVVMPDLQFHPEAKSLMVVGCHADRRSVERRARERGLKIIYIDPEGWWVDGEFKEYPLESPQEVDLILKKGATDAFKDIIGFLEV